MLMCVPTREGILGCRVRVGLMFVGVCVRCGRAAEADDDVGKIAVPVRERETGEVDADVSAVDVGAAINLERVQ